jgi:hypothetical protein
VDLVGLQVWRGALLLSDFLLAHPDVVRGKAVLELAAGTGITSFSTASSPNADVDRGGILDRIRQNLSQNGNLLRQCHSKVAEIDFFKEDWRDDLAADLTDVSVVLAADIVYDREITRNFFRTLEHLISWKGDDRELVVLIAVERRRGHVTGEEDKSNFQYFLDLLDELMERLSGTEWRLEKIGLNFHQYLKCYERVNELNFWKLSRRSLVYVV